ncbi:putative quinone oxidoreductase protein [Phaeoacremonium minimum UCRPA7]|uniref:Probable quinone oxidoreductase n=1 Tax=Phaeoacremonium minimum (strain UCR-PA7) TaxID=1286976 RepID=R8BP88_PHAM7|nr:putative quinone oxidoreductase protein [Phaeoacremonium minimum UCRPA7]EOO01151.1 putative quinone oxidoreductase protein [Phaeoacremonium minimum UCRPA7]
MAAPESVPKTMSGILIEKPGGVEVLGWKEDLTVPELKEGQILVKNEFAGVNYIDTYFRNGMYKSDYPLITGKEAAGVVVAVHDSVKAFAPGDRVVYLDEHTYAQYSAIPAIKAVTIPDGITTKQAAASMLQGLTALTFIREAAGLHPTATLGVGQGPWVLVHAAAGGAGTQLCQMLHATGAKVIGTAGGEAKMEIARKNGAQWVIDSRADDLVEKVKEITNGHGPDVIFDGVGIATFSKDLEMIARKGTLISYGNASGKVPPFDLLDLGPKNVKLLRPVVFNYIATREELETYTRELFDFILSGKVDVKIHEVYPLKDVGRAHSDLEGRKTTGKLLLQV